MSTKTFVDSGRSASEYMKNLNFADNGDARHSCIGTSLPLPGHFLIRF